MALLYKPITDYFLIIKLKGIVMIESIVMLAAIHFAAMMSPGPTTFLVLKNSVNIKDKFYATPLGISCSTFIHVILGVGGLSMIIIHNPFVAEFLKYIGAVYLIYIGAKVLVTNIRERNQRKIIIPVEKSKTGNQFKAAFFEGFLINLFNPKVILFYLGLFSQVITPDLSPSFTWVFGVQIVIQSLTYWLLFSRLVKSNMFQIHWSKWNKKAENIFGGALVAFGIKLGIF